MDMCIHVYICIYVHTYVCTLRGWVCRYNVVYACTYMYICTYVCTHVAVTCLSHDLQEEYEREGIEWVHIDYFNNEVICKLIDSNPQGIFSIMDEECLRPGEENDEVRGGEVEGRGGEGRD